MYSCGSNLSSALNSHKISHPWTDTHIRYPARRPDRNCMKNVESEEKRIRSVYSTRDAEGRQKLYNWYRPEILFNQYRFRHACASILVANGILELSDFDFLDVGCGAGAWLRLVEEWGVAKSRLHGIDLLPDRIDQARQLNPGVDFRIASGWSLPYEDESMDVVTAHTVFSSILQHEYRNLLSNEMQRVLTPKGLILIYDFRISHPRNPDTVGIRRKEIQRLFPGFQCASRTLTLAPPLSRRLAPVSAALMSFLEYFFPILRTHAIYELKKQDHP
jgi:SAM-dependent methyltransferase